VKTWDSVVQRHRLVSFNLEFFYVPALDGVCSRQDEAHSTSGWILRRGDSMQLCAIDALRGTLACSTRFQAVRSDSTRALFHKCASIGTLGPFTRVIHIVYLNPVPAEQARRKKKNLATGPRLYGLRHAWSRLSIPEALPKKQRWPTTDRNLLLRATASSSHRL